MIKFGTDYSKLKKNLKLACARLKILQAKKLEQNERLKIEIANYLKDKKYMQAKVKAQRFINDTASAEAIELINMYCEEILDKYELFSQKKKPDITLERAVASLIWVCPYFQTPVPEFQIVSKELFTKYGSYFKATKKNPENAVDRELMMRVRALVPSAEAIDMCLKRICRQHRITYQNSAELAKKYVEESEQEVSTVLSDDKNQSNLSSATEIRGESAGKMDSHKLRKKSFFNMFRLKHAKISNKDSDETFSSASNENEDLLNVSESVNFEPQQNRQNIESNPDFLEEEEGFENNPHDDTRDYMKECDYMRKLNTVPSAPTLEIPQQKLHCDASFIESPAHHLPASCRFIYDDTPPLDTCVHHSHRNIYHDAPPTYNSLYHNDTSSKIHYHRNRPECFDEVELPSCPTENPVFHSSSEEDIAANKICKKRYPQNIP